MLLKGLASGESHEALAKRVGREIGVHVTVQDVETASRQVAEKVAVIANKRGELLSKFFWLRTRFLPEGLVYRVARRLGFAFHLPWAMVLCAAIACGLVLAFGAGVEIRVADGSLLPAYGLFLISLVVHELGHASATARFGARPSEIGFTMYLIYPALYSDVTQTWKLRRSERVIVDLGGVYLQFVVGAIYVLLHRLTGWEPLWGAFAMILYGSLFSLNPIFKFDGYWMLSDALGVTNLGLQPGRVLQRIWHRLRGRSPEPWPWPTSVTVGLLIYTLLAVFVWGFFVMVLVPVLGEKLVEYPETLGRLFRPVLAGGIPGWTAVRSLLVSSMMLLFAGLMAWRLGRTVMSVLSRRS